MVDLRHTPEKNNFINKNVLALRQVMRRIFDRVRGVADLRDKLILIDSDELLLVWEQRLRDVRLHKEEEAWKRFERTFGIGSPKITDAFIKWQEQLYAYIEQEKDRFLCRRQGAREALEKLTQAGAKTIVVTKGAKPYTQKCFNLTGLSSFIWDIYSPAHGSRAKRFADAAYDYGKNTSWKYLKDMVVVGHDLDKDMAWELVPGKDNANDGNAPVFILFDALEFGKEVVAPLDALPEIMDLLLKRGDDHFLRGFKSIERPDQAKTAHYTFKIALYHDPRRSDRVRIPVILDIKKRYR